MFRITITDLRSQQSETFSSDAEKVLEIKKMLTPSKGRPATLKSKKTKKREQLVIAPDEFLKVIRKDYTGKDVTEDGKFIEYMNGQRMDKYFPHDVFTRNTPGFYEAEDGTCFLEIHLDPSRHGGKRKRMVKLVPKT